MVDPDDFLDSTQEVTITSDRDALLRSDAARGTGRAMLVVMSGARVGERVTLGDEDCVIGRSAEATLQLEGDSVSRVHARVVRRAEGYFLVDARSTNGLYVDYVRVTEKQLEDGNTIQVGQALLKFLTGDNIETAYHEEARRLVRRDALTGALNRPTFDEELRVAVRRAAAGSYPLSLIAFDLDHFKRINDTLGHTAGDRVLREVGQAVEASMAPPHHFARTGGEEFAIVFRGEPEDALRKAEATRALVEALHVVQDGKEIAVTASVGVAAFSGNLSPAELYEAADRKLYAAKQAGRNRVVG
jgi:diguanylate cyclase (GGDEF)-like protein